MAQCIAGRCLGGACSPAFRRPGTNDVCSFHRHIDTAKVIGPGGGVTVVGREMMVVEATTAGSVVLAAGTQKTKVPLDAIRTVTVRRSGLPVTGTYELLRYIPPRPERDDYDGIVLIGAATGAAGSGGPA